MTIYVDPIQRSLSGEWCHMWSDTYGDLTELNAFAKSIGLKLTWLQPAPGSMPHYDLRPNKRKLALKQGAITVSRETLVAHIREWRKVKAVNHDD